MRKTKMNAKKLLVSFLTVMSVLLFVLTVSAATSEIANISEVKVNDVSDSGGEDISVIAGEKITVEVFFEALEDASDVRIEVELKGSKIDSEAERFIGDIEDGKRYREVLTLNIPYDLRDEVSDDLTLDIEIFNGDFKTRSSEIILRVQRPAYNAAVMLIQTNSEIKAGKTLTVDVVLKNIGYNDLDDTYVIVRVPALEIEKTDFFGDLVAIEDKDSNRDDDEDTIRRRIFLQIPYNAESGVYTLEVEVRNDDTNTVRTKQIFIENEVPETVIKSGNGLIIINPSNSVKVYTIIPESPATVSENIVVVPAGSSRTVAINANTAESVSVNVLLGERFIGSVEFVGSKQESSTNLVAVLTIVLTIIFVVLIVVLLVLLTRKPEKEEEFSESYY